MAEQDFTYLVPQTEEVRLSEYQRVLNPLNEVAAATWAYHLPERPVVTDPNAEMQSDPAFAAALGGTDSDPSTGCASLAWAESVGLVEGVGLMSDSLAIELIDSMGVYASTDGGRAELSGWVDCMADNGYDFDTRLSPYEMYGPQPTITAEERAARAADLQCDLEGDVTMTQSEWEFKVFSDWNDETASKWGEVQEAMDRASDELAIREQEQLT